MSKNTLQIRTIEEKILLVRGHKVMLDRDLAVLYQVKAIALRQQVKRNIDRFPIDFMFQLNDGEVKWLVSQNVIPSLQSLGGFRPYAFTEQGVAMLSSVLNSKRAVQVNIQIMRAFVRLKELMIGNEELRRKIKALERNFNKKFAVVFKAIQLLLDGPQKSVRVRGFGQAKK